MTVDEALALFTRPERGVYGAHDWVQAEECADVLAAEVRRLRIVDGERVKVDLQNAKLIDRLREDKATLLAQLTPQLIEARARIDELETELRAAERAIGQALRERVSVRRG